MGSKRAAGLEGLESLHNETKNEDILVVGREQLQVSII
jgi:hypothetical protein